MTIRGVLIRKFRRNNRTALANMKVQSSVRLVNLLQQIEKGFPKPPLRPVSIAMFNLCNDRWGILWKRRGNHNACQRGTLPEYDRMEAKNLGYQYPREEA